MYFDSVSRKYLGAIAELEKEVYPAELSEGLESLEERYSNRGLCFSICGFEKGELKCYILAGYMHGNVSAMEIHIDDLNCLNPKYLHRLLIIFFKLSDVRINQKALYHAELREKSYHLLMNRMKRNPQIIELCSDEYVPGYYPNGENAHIVSFRVHLNAYIKDDWKAFFQARIDNADVFSCNLIDAVLSCVTDKPFQNVDLMKEDVQEYMIKSLAERIIGHYRMFGEHIPTISERELKFRTNNRRAFEKTIHTLEKRGYKDDEGSPKSYMCSLDKMYILLRIQYETYNTQYPDTLSGYRWLYRNTRRNIKKMHFSNTEYYDKYGQRRDVGSVPYLSRTRFRYLMEEAQYINQKLSSIGFNGDDIERIRFTNLVHCVWGLLGKDDAKNSIDSICSNHSDRNYNYFHDWNLLALDVKLAKDFLTKGAIKTIFSSSYNYANQISENLRALHNAVLVNTVSRKRFDIKAMRKKISSDIRNSISLDGFVDEVNEYIDNHKWKSLHIPNKKKAEVEEFVNRMRKYCKGLSVYEVVRRYGKNNLYAFMSGTYPGLFEEQMFTYSYDKFISFLQDMFKCRTRQMKHVYSNFKASGLLTCLSDKSVTEQQYNEMRKILNCHNVKLPEYVTVASDFQFMVEPKGSPEYLAAGDATVCCMGMRNRKALQYALEKGFGILNAYYRERVIANSLLWINDEYNCLVLDNIEVHPNYYKYEKYLKDGFYDCAQKIMMKQNVDFVVQGQNFNDLKLYREDDESYMFTNMYARDVSLPFYSDARRIKVVCSMLSEAKLRDLFSNKDREKLNNQIGGTVDPEELPFAA